MTRTPHRVVIVVDPAFGERLVDLVERMHVWVVRSPANEEVVQRLWAESDGKHVLESGATLFNPAGHSPEDSCLGILSTVEEHHGEYSHDPPLGVIEVFGAEASSPVRDELAELGFNEVDSRPAGFMASRARP